MNKTWGTLLLIIIVLGGIYLLFNKKGGVTAIAPDNLQTFSSPTYGVTFKYPKNYTVTEKDSGTKTRPIHRIALTDTATVSSTATNGEGPTAITVDILQNHQEMELQTFIKIAPESNFKLSKDETFSTTTISGSEAVAYTWDGLYQGTTIALEHKADVMFFNVTSLTPEDQILKDFAQVVGSLQLN